MNNELYNEIYIFWAHVLNLKKLIIYIKEQTDKDLHNNI